MTSFGAGSPGGPTRPSGAADSSGSSSWATNDGWNGGGTAGGNDSGDQVPTQAGGTVTKTASVGKATPVGPTATNGVPNSAQSILNDFLDSYGLGSLAGWAWQIYTQAGGGDLGMQVVQAELPNTAQFKARFPAIADRVKAGLPPITVQDYLNYETGIRQAFVQNGIALPTVGQGFDDIVTGLLNKDVSLNEVVSDRIGKALAGYSAAPDEVKQAFDQVYGVHGAAALTTKILDPSLADPQIEKLAQAAQLLGTGRHYGINLSVQDAIGLAGQDQGQSGSGAQQFLKLAQLSPLFQSNVGEGSLSAAQGAGFEFGTDAQDALDVQRRLAARQAAFAGGGGAAVTQNGVVGLGPASEA